MIRYLIKNWEHLVCMVITMLLYYHFVYYFHRADFAKLLGIYIPLFYFSYRLIRLKATHFTYLFVVGFLFRLIYWTSIPTLSQDFYRFIWDGKLILDGINPYIFTPNTLIETSSNRSIYERLYEGMGDLSANHYSNYPPVNQFFFFLGAIFSEKGLCGSIVFYRTCIILADIGILFVGRKILDTLKLPQHQIFWYFLNPLIIVELTGNLHFEGVMLFFLTVSLYFIFKHRWIFAGIFMALSISVKLLPLVLLPLFYRWFFNNNDRKQITGFHLLIFYSITGIIVLLTFLPFISEDLLSNYSQTIGLWFKNFEFNASIYYLVRSIGHVIKGYNVIATAGTRMALLVFLFIILIAFFKKNERTKTLLTSCLYAVTFYFFMTTTLHPWYLATPILLAVFTGYKYPLIWGFAAILSYQAYSTENFKENNWILFLEYTLVFGFFLYEVYFKRPILKQLK